MVTSANHDQLVQVPVTGIGSTVFYYQPYLQKDCGARLIKLSVCVCIVLSICVCVHLGCAVSKKWLRFGFPKNCGFQFGFGFTKLTVVSVYGSDFCIVCCLMCMMLKMTYFRAELVQLIVSRSDSEPKVQRYGMKKNTVTVDPIML